MGSTAKIVLERAFSGDENEVLKRIQEQHYDWLRWRMVERCVTVYKFAERVLGVQTEIGDRLRDEIFLPPELLEDLYSAMAARMRYNFPELIQPSLFDTPEQYVEMLEANWRRYLFMEANELAEETLFVRAIATIAFDARSHEGRAARKIVEGVLTMRYKSLYRPNSLVRLEEWVERHEM
jgi:hypothetical protein